MKRINAYHNAFQTYNFSTVVLRKEDIGSAIEVFTRINTGGQTLTLFEIMSAKTYDEAQGFDMQAKWKRFIKELEAIKYEGVSSTVILSLLSLVLSKSKECRRETILALDKQNIIDHWEAAISGLKDSIDYFRTTYRIPVSRLLPYDTLLVPFAYFFFKNKEEYNRKEPDSGQRQYLEEFFWRMSLSHRYTGAGDTLLAQDIRRIDRILEHERPDYADVKVDLSTETLIQTNFNVRDSYCKAVLCLLAYQEPKDFHDNGKVILDNSNLQIASSRNYHHFFPKSYLKKNETANSKSLVNITLVSARLNQHIIRSRAPSDYIRDFTDENPGINKALNSHCIDINGFGIESDDYDTFLEARASRISEELKARIDLNHRQPDNEEIQELIAAGESERVELKSTLRYDLRAKSPNKKIEYAIAKTIAAFLNSEGGDLFIGIDDEHNALGLEDDIQTLSKNNLDGFNLHLVGIIRNYIGGDYSGHVKITFPVYDDVEICRVQVAKSSESVFTTFEGKQDFFVRSSCASIPLTPQEQSGYEKKHYGS